MEEYWERGELRKMQREQERERRRVRDRERRQSMTHEQRERHLARRRRNYQLRRQRAANNNNSAYFPHEDETATTSHDGHPSLVSECSILDYRILQTESEQKFSQGDHMEALTHKATNFPKMLRLNHIRQLARNLIHSIADHDSQIMIDRIVPDLIPNENLSPHDNKLKSLRLNRVKHLARSQNSPS